MTDVFERLKSALADQYAIDREIGRGGMASVFPATDVRHKRKVAIKVLHPDLAASVGHGPDHERGGRAETRGHRRDHRRELSECPTCASV